MLEALADADQVIVCPSNPILSIGPILALPRVTEVLRRRRAVVSAISPIVAGAALKGPADRIMAELGHDPSVVGVARLYSPIASTLVVDDADVELASAVEATGVACRVTGTVMHGPAEAAALARAVLAPAA